LEKKIFALTEKLSNEVNS